MAEQWSMFIDIEGFSALWEREAQVLLALGELMRGIFRVGRLCFPDDTRELHAQEFDIHPDTPSARVARAPGR